MVNWDPSGWFAMLSGAALKGTVVLGAAWLLAVALRRKSASKRHLVWTAAAAALLALPVLSLVLPALRVRNTALSTVVPNITFHTTAVAKSGPAGASATSAVTPAAGAQKLDSRPNLRLWIVGLWAAGSLLGLIHMLVAWGVMRRVRQSSNRWTDPDMFPELSYGLDIRESVELIELPAGSMPLNFGILRPAVFLPADAREWSAERRRVVLLHELAHVKRGDVATNLMMRTALCLFWWNPLAWVAWRESVKERERAADDLVLAAGETATDYASHLLEIARTTLQARTPVASAAIAMARPSQLEGRLLAILDSRLDRNSSGPQAAAIAAVLAVILVAPFAALQAQEKLDPVTAPVVDSAIRVAVEQKNHEITDSAAAAYVSTQKYDAAQKLLEKSLTIRAETAGDHSSTYAAGLMKLGDLAAQRNKTNEAVDFYTKAVALGDTKETAPALLYLAVHALTEGDQVAGAAFVDRALAVAPTGPLAGRALIVKASIALKNGLAGVAETQYQQAIADMPADSPEAALAMETYARLLNTQNRGPEAEALLNRAKPIRQGRVAQVTSRWTGTDTPIRVGAGITAPVLIYKSEPEYSQEARFAKYQGTVVLSVTVGTDGRAYDMQVIKSAGLGLDEKAAEAVSNWKFAPGKKDGVAVPVAANIEVNFRLM